jgi:conjugal transfer/entry exclusion protein
MALPVKAGIPVIDGTNVVQTTISAVNNVQAVAKQIQQYQTQLQQYENMLKIQSHLRPISGIRQIQPSTNCCRRRTHLITTKIRPGVLIHI